MTGKVLRRILDLGEMERNEKKKEIVDSFLLMLYSVVSFPYCSTFPQSLTKKKCVKRIDVRICQPFSYPCSSVRSSNKPCFQIEEEDRRRFAERKHTTFVCFQQKKNINAPCSIFGCRSIAGCGCCDGCLHCGRLRR